MTVHEIRDLEAARQFIVEGLQLQRVVAVSDLRPALEWALELAAAGQPLPPTGFVADIGHILVGFEGDGPTRGKPAGPSGWPSGLARSYEDLVLGKLLIDGSIERAGYAVRRYHGRDRTKAVAFVVHQMRERCGVGGVLLSPAVIKALLDGSDDGVLASGWASATRGVPPLLMELYEELMTAVRRMADALGPEDVFELEHGTALAELGQRVALRQVLQTAARLEAALPQHRPRPRSTPRETPTRLLDEDTYPVGGFASISTRGTIESLLHSQLAFMEPATAARPDLFDIKFIRDELLYYSRDENQFLRRRRSFVIALLPDLARARFKDVDLPAQRIVLTLAALLVVVRKTTEWLGADALTFQFLFVAEGDTQPLAQEEALLTMVFRDAIANGTVQVMRAASLTAAGEVVVDRARRSVCSALMVGAVDTPLPADGVDVARLIVEEARPRLVLTDDGLSLVGDDAWAAWQGAILRLLVHWV